MVPGAFGVDDRQRTLFTDAQAIGFGPEDVIQATFGEAGFEEVPDGEAFFLGTALRLRLVSTDENVTLDLGEREAVGLLGEAFVIDRIHRFLL